MFFQSPPIYLEDIYRIGISITFLVRSCDSFARLIAGITIAVTILSFDRALQEC